VRSETSRISLLAEEYTFDAIWNGCAAKVGGARGKAELPCDLPMGQLLKLKFIGLKRMGLGAEISKSRGYCDE
jgi:hypothetical protein